MPIFRATALLLFSALGAVAQTIPDLPPAMKRVEGDAEMMALWNHEARAVETPQMADAAMRVLFALSYHVAGCHGPDAVALPIRITSTTTTRDGFGIVRGEETDTFDQVLKVRPEFVPLARRTVGYYSDNVLNRRFVAVRDLISQDRCEGPRLRHLEEGLAKAAGVTLAAAPPQDTALGADWRGFISSCMGATYPDIINNQLNAARVCNFVEAALVELGNAEWYEVFRKGGIGAEPDWSDANKDRFNAVFDAYYKDHDGPIRVRGEQFVAEAGLF